jgi:hypothetical protein
MKIVTYITRFHFILTDFFFLVNKTNKYSKLVISLLGFAQIARPEFETQVRVFFYTQKRKKIKKITRT